MKGTARRAPKNASEGGSGPAGVPKNMSCLLSMGCCVGRCAHQDPMRATTHVYPIVPRAAWYATSSAAAQELGALHPTGRLGDRTRERRRWQMTRRLRLLEHDNCSGIALLPHAQGHCTSEGGCGRLLLCRAASTLCLHMPHSSSSADRST